MHTNIKHLFDETLILPIHEHLELHASQYKQKTQHPSHPLHPHTITTTDIKTNMRHIHTSIVSIHLVTRGNNEILRTPPPHINSSEEILPRLTRRTLAQLRTNVSPFLKSYLHKVAPNHIHLHYYPSVTHDTHYLFNFTHICTTLSPLDLWLARWTKKLAGGPQAGTSDSPTSKGHVSG